MCLWTTVSSNQSLAQQVLQILTSYSPLSLVLLLLLRLCSLTFQDEHCVSSSCLSTVHGRSVLLFACGFQLSPPTCSSRDFCWEDGTCVSFSTTIQQEASSVLVSFCHSTYYWLERLQEKFRWLDILIYELLLQLGINPFWLMETNLLKSTSEVFNHRQCVLQSWGIWKCEECGFSCHNDWWYSAMECLGTKLLLILQSMLWLSIMKSGSVEKVVIALLRNMALWKKGGVVRNQVKWGCLSPSSLHTESH